MYKLTVSRTSRARPRRGGGRQSWIPPALIAIALGAFAVWGFMTADRNVASFATHAITATAVIQQVHFSAPQGGMNGPSRYSEYGDIRYMANGRHETSRIVLANCYGECFPVYHAGEAVRVSYDSQNGDVTFPALRPGSGVDTSGLGGLAWVAALIGVFSLVVAVGRMGRQPAVGARA
jgi:hypothetical protein